MSNTTDRLTLIEADLDRVDGRLRQLQASVDAVRELAASLRGLLERAETVLDSGETCSCGRPAVTVYQTAKFGRVGDCGVHNGGVS